MQEIPARCPAELGGLIRCGFLISKLLMYTMGCGLLVINHLSNRSSMVTGSWLKAHSWEPAPAINHVLLTVDNRFMQSIIIIIVIMNSILIL